jgi:hypothetical protein
MSSLYRYLRKRRTMAEMENISSLKDFLVRAREGCQWIGSLPSMRPQVDFLSFPDGRVRIDFLGHFEHLEDDIDSVSRKLRIPAKPPHKNASSNSGHDYRSAYDEEMIEIVSALFADDCRYFGYEFERAAPTRRCSGRFEDRRRG